MLNLKKIWNELNNDFVLEKEYFLFALAIITRYTVEHLAIKKEIGSGLWSSLHSILHKKSVHVSRETLIDTLYKIIINFPEEYKHDKILEKISFGSNDDFFFIDNNKNPPISKKYQKEINIYIVNKNILSIKNQIFQYKAFCYKEDWQKGNEITFVSNKELLKSKMPYKIKLKGVLLNGTLYNYCLKSFYSLEDEFKKIFFNEFKIPFSQDIKFLIKKSKINLMNNPELIKNIESRKLIQIFHAAKSFDFRFLTIKNNLMKYWPFYQEYLNVNLPYIQISRSSIKEFIKIAYEKQEWFQKNYSNYLIEYNVKKNADKTNDAITTQSIFIKHSTSKYKLKNYNNLNYIDDYYRIIFEMNNIFSTKIENQGIKFTEDYWKKLANKKGIFLHGPAGHGKTYAIKEFIKINKEKNFLVIAPSWKALSIYNNIKNIGKPLTIQKISHSIKHKKINNVLTNQYNINDKNFLIIDEVSMIDDWDFLYYLPPKIQIIFSGDNKQLPPINGNQKSLWLEEIAKSQKLLVDFGDKKIENKRLFLNSEGIQKKEDSFEQAKILDLLIKDIRKEKFSFKDSRYAEKIVICKDDKEIIEKIQYYSKNNYISIVRRNTGKLGTIMLNKLLSKSNNHENQFSIGDEIIFKDQDINENPLYYKNLEGVISNKIFSEEDDKIKYKINTAYKEDIDITCGISDEPFVHKKVINAHRVQGSTLLKVAVIIDKPIEYRWLYSAASRCSEDLIIIVKSDLDDSDLLKTPKIQYKQALILNS